MYDDNPRMLHVEADAMTWLDDAGNWAGWEREMRFHWARGIAVWALTKRR